MKTKLIALVLVCVLVLPLALCGCSGSQVSVYPVLSATSAKAGDTVTVQVLIEDCERLCSSDLYLTYDRNYVTPVNGEEAVIADLYTVLSNDVDAAGNGFFKYSFYTATTIDLDDVVLFTVQVTVNADAPAGEAAFRIAIDEFNKGNDAQGNTYTDIKSEVSDGYAVLTVS